MLSSSYQGYLHIGAHKTASTFLQNQLRKNRKALKAEGISVLLVSGEFNKRFTPHYFQFLRDSLQSGMLNWNSPCRERAAAELTDVLSNLKTQKFILSDERLLYPMPGYTSRLYPTAGFAAEFLKQMMGKARIKVIIYIREQAAFLESCFLQYFRENGPKKSFNEFIDTVDLANLSWKPVIAEFTERFGQESVIVLSYEAIKQGMNSFVSDFFSVFSDHGSIELEREKVNPRFSQKAMDLFTLMHPQLTREEAFKTQVALKRLFPVGSEYPPPKLFSEDETAALGQLYGAENLELLEKFRLT